MTEYWFARRFPLGDRRNAMAPVHWKGWLVTLAFTLALTAGGVAFAWYGASGKMMQGIAFFAIAAFIGGVFFISASRERTDRIRTVADYKKEQQSV